ncbi:MAG: HEAT repeat domain-containing protein [Sedimentisphaerales bacterium]|nr:HEAT repeat domain-containing protein [Sedimentisphaerales bacterium]
MSIGKSNKAVLATGTAAATAGAADRKAVNQLIDRIKDSDPEVRTEAWLGAGNVGAAAVRPLAKVMTDEDLEVARAAKRALWQIVRHVGRPGAEEERKAVATRLARLLGDKQPVPVRREVLWMLSEIGKAGVVKPMARLLENEDLREDARMALELMPDKRSLTVLKAALETVPETFKPNIAQSLRRRGQTVRGYPCAKLVPTRTTRVEALK